MGSPLHCFDALYSSRYTSVLPEARTGGTVGAHKGNYIHNTCFPSRSHPPTTVGFFSDRVGGERSSKEEKTKKKLSAVLVWVCVCVCLSLTSRTTVEFG